MNERALRAAPARFLLGARIARGDRDHPAAPIHAPGCDRPWCAACVVLRGPTPAPEPWGRPSSKARERRRRAVRSQNESTGAAGPDRGAAPESLTP